MFFWKILIEIADLQKFIKQIRTKILKESQYFCYLCFFDVSILFLDVRQPKLPDVVPVKISCSAPIALLYLHSGLDA